VLPHEQAPNPYVTPELSLQFHYFAIRKMQFLMNAKALAVFPGGFGTLDETFETLTLIQTGRVAPMPVLLFGESFWRRIMNFEALAEEGTISPDDHALFSFVETGEQGWEKIRQFYGIE
jgi:predicted Rossmann-fold nucleotide-binding protein